MNRSQALQYIEQLFEKGKLEDATYRFALDAVGYICGEASISSNEELQNFQSPEDLAHWRRIDALRWQEELDEEEFAERFDVGCGRAYGCIEQMLSCTDHDFVLDLIGQVQIAEC